MSIEYDISTYNNITFSLTVNWETFSNGASGSPIPVNLTGYQSILQVRQYAGSPVALFSVGSFPASGITFTPAASGAISININPINYLNIGTGNFYYDLLMIDTLGNQYVLLYGQYVLQAGVSQNQVVAPNPSPPNSVTVSNLTVLNTLTVDGLSTLAFVGISGGTIDNTAIGSIIQDSGKFTVLSNSASANFYDVNITGYLTVPSNSTGVTQASGTNNTLLSTTAFVTQAINNLSGTYAPLYSPGLGGVPTAPTAASGTNNTQIATTAFVTSLIGSSSGGNSGVTIKNSGTTVGTGVTTINAASGIIATVSGSTATFSASASNSGVVIQNNGTAVGSATTLNLATNFGTATIASGVATLSPYYPTKNYVTGARALSTVYTNSTGKRMQVYVTVLTSTSDEGGNVTFNVNSANVSLNTVTFNAYAVNYTTQANVNPGDTYEVLSPGTGASVAIWMEEY